MAVDTVTCPKCETTLRSATPFPPGKRIKCPRCAAVFMVQAEDEDMAEAVKPRPRPAPSRKVPPPEDVEDFPDDEEPAARRPARKPRPADYDEDEEQESARKPVRNPRPADEEDEEEAVGRNTGRRHREDDYDDRPRRRQAGTKKGGGKALVLILVIGGVVLLLGLGAVGAWVWPGFLKSGSSSDSSNSPGEVAGATFTSCRDALTYLPRDCTKVIGIDVAGLRKDPRVAASVEDMVTQFPSQYACTYGDFLATVKKQTGKEFKDWCDYLVWGTIGPAAKLAVFKTNVDIKADDLIKGNRWAAKKEVQGKTYYEFSTGEFRYLYLPSPRLIVLGGVFLNEAQLPAIFTATGAPAILTGDFNTAFTRAEKSHFWKIEDQKWNLTVLDNQLKSADNIPIYKKQKPYFEAMVQAKPAWGVTCVAVGTSEVAYVAWVVCKDEASARQVASTAESAAKALTDDELKAALMGNIPRGPVTRPDAVEGMVREALTTQKFASDKTLATRRSYWVKRQNYDVTLKK